MSSAWHELESALERRERPVVLWWRDDDAGRFSPELVPLLDLAERHRAPLALAVVPAWLDERVRASIQATEGASVLQHGWAHRNHAPPGGRKIELGGTHPTSRIVDELARGRRLLEEAFGARFLPVLTPPWNRIDAEIVARLPELGFEALSTFGPRPAEAPAPGLRQLNAHLDILDWSRDGAFLGGDGLLERLSAVVAASGEEPIGILTHHARMRDDAFAWLDRLLAVVRGHPKVTLESVAALLGEGA